MHELSIHRRKRNRPSDEVVAWRKEKLASLSELDPLNAALPVRPHIEPGNKKTGLSGKFFSSIWVWNLPPVATCPGRSKWCVAYCYNADPREEVYPVAMWLENLRLIEEHPEETARQIVAFIQSQPKSTALRIHSSGDFYSNKYIALWADIIAACPDARFWAYTRSWTVPSLRAELEALRALKNLQLFASWDATMPKPPDGWRLSIISEGAHHSTQQNLDCPEQYEGGLPCVDCGYCIRKKSGNVIFHSH